MRLDTIGPRAPVSIPVHIAPTKGCTDATRSSSTVTVRISQIWRHSSPSAPYRFVSNAKIANATYFHTSIAKYHGGSFRAPLRSARPGILPLRRALRCAARHPLFHAIAVMRGNSLEPHCENCGSRGNKTLPPRACCPCSSVTQGHHLGVPVGPLFEPGTGRRSGV